MHEPVTVEMVLLCESVTIGPEGRPIYRHVVSDLVVPALPYTVDVLCYAAEIWGASGAPLEIAFAVVGPGESVLVRSPHKRLPPVPDGIRNFGGTLERLELRAEGRHEFRIEHEGEVIGRARFVVEIDPARGEDAETYP